MKAWAVTIGAALSGCAVVVGPCEVTREPALVRVACSHGGAALVVPMGTLKLLREGTAAPPGGPQEPRKEEGAPVGAPFDAGGLEAV